MGCCGDEPEEVDANIKGVAKDRSCTDVFWLAIFILFWIGMVVIAALSLIHGNPVRLLNGYDSFGNICGYKKNSKMGDLPLSGIDTSDKKYLFYLDISDLAKSLQLCVKMCPDKELSSMNDIKEFYDRTGSSLCKYDFNLTTLNANADNSAITKTVGPCPVLPVSRSSSVIHRCVPTAAAKVIAGASKKVYQVLNSWDVIEQALTDVYSSWGTILILTCCAFVLSLLVVGFLHFVASMVAWIIMIAVSIACVVGTCLLWWAYADAKWHITNKDLVLDKESRNSTALLVYAIVATVFTLVILLLVWVMRKRISLMAQLFKESSACLGDLPYLFFQPFVIFAVLLAFFAFWTTIVVSLATAAYPVSKSVMPLGNGNDTSAVITSNMTSGKGSPFKALKFVDFDNSPWIKYMWWYYFIGLIWTSEFILACEQMVIAGAVAAWYFDGNRSNSGSPVSTAVSNLVSYHLGSMALGSLLITILKVPRLILSYLYARMKQNEETSQCASCGLKCCICCFYCLEKCVRFMNHNAYTVIAVQGINFCSGARRAFTIMVNNALQLATINSVGDFILFLGKCFVTAVIGSAALVILKADTTLKFYAVPTLVITLFAFFVAHAVLSLYETVIDTLFLCMCEDQSMNGEEGNWKKSKVVELHQEMMRKESEDNAPPQNLELERINNG